MQGELISGERRSCFRLPDAREIGHVCLDIVAS